jgi:hypothetical protein
MKSGPVTLMVAKLEQWGSPQLHRWETLLLQCLVAAWCQAWQTKFRPKAKPR